MLRSGQSSGQPFIMHFLWFTLYLMKGFSEAIAPSRAPTGQSLLQKYLLSFKLKTTAIMGITKSSRNMGLITLVRYVVDLR